MAEPAQDAFVESRAHEVAPDVRCPSADGSRGRGGPSPAKLVSRRALASPPTATPGRHTRRSEYAPPGERRRRRTRRRRERRAQYGCPCAPGRSRLPASAHPRTPVAPPGREDGVRRSHEDGDKRIAFGREGEPTRLVDRAAQDVVPLDDSVPLVPRHWTSFVEPSMSVTSKVTMPVAWVVAIAGRRAAFIYGTGAMLRLLRKRLSGS
jgi:hypothetical protein